METKPRLPTDPGKNDRDLEPGQQVGEYVVESKIGEGGFGTVYRTRHPLIGKLAAVKVLSRQYSADPEIVSRFVDEARAVNQIRHRNIIDIFAFGQLDDERSYYVMELLDGEPLDQLIDEAGGFSLGDAIPILRGIARALDAAHASGVAHRDLKPENIFLARESDGTRFPKLLDFGIAKLFGDRAVQSMHKTRTGSPMGTPYYMSPEQCRGKDVDHRTDIYAFGCVAYKLLAGQVPFDGENHMDILLAQTSAEPTPPSQVVELAGILPPLPVAVDDVIAWLMRKDPADRPPDLMTAVHALEDIASAAGVVYAADSIRTPISVTPVPSRPSAPRLSSARAAAAPTPTPAPAPSRSRRLIPFIALAAAALAGAVVTIVLTRGDDAPAAQPPPPPAPVAPAIDPQPPAPAEPSFVTIRIAGPPAGTDVFGPNGPLGPAPGEIQLVRGPDEIQLVLKRDGYETETIRVSPTDDGSIDVAMTKKAATSTASKPVIKKPIIKRPVVKPTPRPGTGSGSAKPKPKPDPYGRK